MRGCASAAVLCVLSTVLGGAAASADGAPVPVPAQLVIVSDRDGDFDVYSISADGRRVGALTRNRVGDDEVLLSPAGGWIALSRWNAGAVLVRSDGRREEKLGSLASARAFSPDGRWLALARDANFLAETTRVELARVGSPVRIRKLGPGQPLAFSKDGRRLSYYNDDNAGVIDLQTGKRTTILSRLPDSPGEVIWSPDLTGLIVRRARDETGAESDLVYFPARNRAKGVVIASGRIFDVTWLDESRIGLSTSRRGVDELRVTRVDGTARRVVARGKIAAAAWDPTGRRVAYSVRDGHAVAIASTLTRARRTVEVGRREPRDLSWSPSGRRLAFSVGGAKSKVWIVEPQSGTVVRRIESPGFGDWAPDESAVAVEAETGVDILSLRDGLRSVWKGGNTNVLGWMPGPLSANVPLVSPPPQPELATPSGFRSLAPVLEISSDGEWVGAIVAEIIIDAEHVVAWTPNRSIVVRFTIVRPGGYGSYHKLSVAGTALTWQYFYCGNYCYLAPCKADTLRPGAQFCDEESADEVRDQPTRASPAHGSIGGVQMNVKAGAIELSRLADGRRQTIRPPGRLVDAELETSGLYYAYNVNAKFRGRIVFVPFAALFR